MKFDVDLNELYFSSDPNNLQWVNDLIEVMAKVEYPSIAIVSRGVPNGSTLLSRRLARVYGELRSGLTRGEQTVFRAPHHTISSIGIFGTIYNQAYIPGELALAEGGTILFDQFNRFSKDIRDRMLTVKRQGRGCIPCFRIFNYHFDTNELGYEETLSDLKKQIDVDCYGGDFDLVIEMSRTSILVDYTSIHSQDNNRRKTSNAEFLEKIRSRIETYSNC